MPKPFYMSYSQSTDLIEDGCLYKWKLRRIDQIKLNKPSIFSTFGTAIHETLQDWIEIIYEKSKKQALNENLYQNFENKLLEVYQREKENNNNNIDYVTLEDIKDVVEDSKKIIRDFKIKWFEYFNVNDWKLLGIEKKVNIPIYENIKNLRFFGMLDVVMLNKKTNERYIIDLKTSYMGWNNKKKKESKDQLLYYKKYYAQQYKIELDKIIPMYIILRRKIFGEDKMEFKINRVSKFIPASKRALKKSIEDFKNKIEKVFYFENDEAFIKLDNKDLYKPNPSKDNCKWCNYKGTEYCKEGK